MDNHDLNTLLRTMVEHDASDLYLTAGAQPQLKVNGVVRNLTLPAFEAGQVRALAYSVLSDKAVADYEKALEYNFAYTPTDIGRFRINIYQQRGETAMVARRIHEQIPSFDELGLGDFLRDWPKERLCTVPATDLSRKHVGRPMPNVPLLAGFAAASGIIRLESVIKAINTKFSEKIASNNIAAASEAYQFVLDEVAGASHEEAAHA